MLTSDLSDPNSFANKQASASYRALAAAFNFQTDGTIAAGAQTQSADQLNHAVDLYSADYDDSAISAEKIETAYYQQRIGSITSVDDLLKDSRLYNYVLKAFGLDPSSESKIRLKLVLEAISTIRAATPIPRITRATRRWQPLSISARTAKLKRSAVPRRITTCCR